LINILKNKHTKKNCAPSCLYLQDYTGMHGQQIIKRKDNWVFVKTCSSIVKYVVQYIVRVLLVGEEYFYTFVTNKWEYIGY